MPPLLSSIHSTLASYPGLGTRLIVHVQAAICCSANSVYCHYNDQGMRSTNNSCIPCMIHPQYVRPLYHVATELYVQLSSY